MLSLDLDADVLADGDGVFVSGVDRVVTVGVVVVEVSLLLDVSVVTAMSTLAFAASSYDLRLRRPDNVRRKLRYLSKPITLYYSK